MSLWRVCLSGDWDFPYAVMWKPWSSPATLEQVTVAHSSGTNGYATRSWASGGVLLEGRSGINRSRNHSHYLLILECDVDPNLEDPA